MRQPGAVYFVTFRTADSIPAGRLRQWRDEAALEMDAGSAGTHVARESERLLDAGMGRCPFAEPKAAAIVADAFRFFDEQRYLLDLFVVMPNHAHVLVCPLPEHELSDILQPWKRFTAREVNRLFGRLGTLWQDESFDHIVRDTAALGRFRDYIRRNPLKVPDRYTVVGRGRFAEVTGI